MSSVQESTRPPHGEPSKRIYQFSDAAIAGLDSVAHGRYGTAAIGVLHVASTGYGFNRFGKLVGRRGCNEAEMIAIREGLANLADNLRNPSSRKVLAMSDCKVAINILNRVWGKQVNLLAIRDEVEEIARAFDRVAFHKISSHNTTMRACESSANGVLRQHNYRFTHRGSKGAAKKPNKLRFLTVADLNEILDEEKNPG